MRSTWPVLSATVVLGIGLGTWIAGVPSSDGSISVASGTGPGSMPPGNGPSSADPVGPLASLQESTVPMPVAVTTVPPSQPLASTSTPDTTGTAPTTVPETAPTESAPAETSPPLTTPPTTSADTAPAQTAAPGLLERSQVRLVVGNGDGRWNLVGANVARLEPLGYTEIDQTDLTRTYDRTILYVRPGFEAEAVRLAADLLVPGALIESLPNTPVTTNDEAGDIIVVLGADAIR